MCRVVTIILLCQIIFSGRLPAQSPDLNLEMMNPRFSHLSGVGHIYQDDFGFLWFGTGTGLTKFDGYQALPFRNDPSDSSTISDNTITAIIEDFDHNLWIGTINGLNRLNPATGKCVRYKNSAAHPQSLNDNYITALLLDQAGVLWIGTQHGGLNEAVLTTDQNPDSLKFIHHQFDSTDVNSLSSNYIRFITDDKVNGKNILVIGTDRGLNIYNRASRSFTRYLTDAGNPSGLMNNDLWSVYEDKAGDFWLGTGGGWLSRMNYSNQGQISYSHYNLGQNTKVFSITEDKEDNLWLATGFHGLYRFNKKDETLKQYMNENLNIRNQNDIYPTTCFADRNGILWIGTWPYLYKNDPRRKQFKFAEIAPPPPLWQVEMTFAYEKNSDFIWIGAQAQGILKFNINSGAIGLFASDSTRKRHLSSVWVTDLIEDRGGAVWISTFKGLNRYDHTQDRFYQYYWDPDKPDGEQKLISNYIYCLYEDRNRNIWIGSARGLTRLDPSRRKFRHYLNQAESINRIGHYIGDILEDSRGEFWIGCKGLFRFDPQDGICQRYYHNLKDSTGTIDAVVLSIYEDSKGNIWVATSDGLYRLGSDQSFTRFMEEDGLSSNYVTDLIEDEKGILWISTYKKLTSYDPLSNHFRIYDTVRDGFGKIYQGKNGQLYFCQPNGLLMFHPDQIIDNSDPPSVWITDFSVFNKPVYFNQPLPALKEITLSYEQNFFSLNFVALNYTEPQKNKYVYILEGVDPDWVQSGTKRSASYTNVIPGEYIFKVRAANNDGVWNNTGSSIRIIITPPWWRTTWAYLSYLILIIILILILRHYDLKRQRMKHELALEHEHAQKLQEIDHLKSRFFANISHEFRTPLTLILGPVEQMLSGNFRGNLQNQYQMILRNGRRLLRLINQLLDLSKLESGGMTLRAREENVVQLVRLYVQAFESLAKRKGIRLRFEAEQDNISAFVDRDKLEKILNNLLSNAFKFTEEGGEVAVSVTPLPSASPLINKGGIKGGSEGHIQISVSDTGTGIPADRLDKIFDRFYQVDHSQKRAPASADEKRSGSSTFKNNLYLTGQEGTGIGLALTKELVELHHGKIVVQSEVGKGSVFTILLPLGKAHLREEEILYDNLPAVAATTMEADDAIHYSEPLRIRPGKPTLKMPILLIVEDNSDMRTYMRGYLDRHYRIVEAGDGLSGWNEAIKNIPDLIISDVMMPGMDGLELCARLKRDERTSHIPVVLLTARVEPTDKIEGLETGADEYLAKPFVAGELLVRIDNLIRQRRALRERFSRESRLNFDALAPGSVDAKFLQRLNEIVMTHLSETNFKLENLAGEIGMSRMTLHRKILGLSGQSAGQFVRTIRLKRAAELLLNRTVNVSEIAYEVGFESPANFSRNFRRQFGVSPSDYCNR